MKHIHLPVLIFLFACASCGAQNKPAPSKEKIETGNKEVPPSSWTDTKYEYTDSSGGSVIIENGFPRGSKYTGPGGEGYGYALFWTRVTNETGNPLELKIDFPVDAFEPPWLPGKYYQVLVTPDTMTIDREKLYDYGLTDLKSFIDNNLHKPSSLKRTISPKESSGFYVVIISRVNEGAHGALRTGFSIKGQDLFYRVSVVKGPPPLTLVSEKEIWGGRIGVKGLKVRE